MVARLSYSPREPFPHSSSGNSPAVWPGLAVNAATPSSWLTAEHSQALESQKGSLYRPRHTPSHLLPWLLPLGLFFMSTLLGHTVRERGGEVTFGNKTEQFFGVKHGLFDKYRPFACVCI